MYLDQARSYGKTDVISLQNPHSHVIICTPTPVSIYLEKMSFSVVDGVYVKVKDADIFT